MSGLLLAGDTYFDRLDDNDQYTGIVRLFDSKKFAITEPSTAKPRESRGRDDYGQTKDVAYVKGAPTVALEGDEVSPAVLGLALMGDVAPITQSAGTVTAATVNLKQDVYIQLPHANIDDASFELKNAAGDVTHVKGTDYKVLGRMGWIMALTPAAATAGAKVSYEHGVLSGSRVTGGALPTIRGRLILDGINLATRKPIVVTCDEARLAPSGEIDFSSADYVKVALQGLLRTQPGKAGPYTVDYRNA